MHSPGKVYNIGPKQNDKQEKGDDMASRICPFMSGDNGNGLRKVECIGPECQLYYDEAEQCALNEVVEYLDMMNTSLMMK